MLTRLAPTIAALAIAIGVAACGGSGNTTTHLSGSATSAAATTTAAATAQQSSTRSSSAGAPMASHTVNLSANSGGALMFSTSSLQASAGRVVIHFTNHAPEAHNLTLQSASGTTIAATPTFTGGTRTLVVTLKPGTYTYFCSVPGHRAGGMQGTLKVS